MTFRAYRAFQALILALLGIYFINMIWSGTVFWYINVRFLPLTLIGAFGFLWLASVLFNARRADGELDENARHAHADHDPTHDHTAHAGHDHAPSRRALVLIALPILLGTLIPAQPLGSSAVANRGLTNNAPLQAGQDAAPVQFEIASTDRTVLDWLRAFNYSSDPAQYEGQQADVIGFVYHDTRLESDQFLLGRFTLTCCVADAAAIAVLVDWPAAQDYPSNTWVRVRGPIYAGELDGEPTPRIEAQVVEEIPPPDQPYLYN